ncbi:MAG: NADH-quinone oxidoreductase subunit A [Proteobacteria bacterium]|nr:NADH-quinone oxidoreductase subunit A [Pseudomonadota bacterium]NCA27905.1 NADH-quinone oxidoreductase subunit A [Pseudomonadota bacterium]
MENSLINFAEPNFVSAQYLPVLIFLIVAIGLSVVIILIPFIINKMRPDPQKNSPYECGFEGEGPVRNEFKVQFYLVAILFIIFDLEVAFLFPWAVALKEIGLVGFWSMIIFLTILTLGFVYEWKRGALEWK